MKEEALTKEQRADLVKYYFERAHESIEEAKYLRDGGYYNGSVTRLYYACFNAARGLLTANDIDTSTHNGVKTMISMEFIRKGLLSMVERLSNQDVTFQRMQCKNTHFSLILAHQVVKIV